MTGLSLAPITLVVVGHSLAILEPFAFAFTLRHPVGLSLPEGKRGISGACLSLS